MDILETYEIYGSYIVAIRNCTELTVKNGRRMVKIFVRETGITEIKQVNEHLVRDYFLRGRIEKKWMPNTFISHHKSLNVFWKWCVKQGYADINPFGDIEKPRQQKKVPRRLTKNQAQILLETALNMRVRYKFQRYRNYALIATMLFTGLRRCEVLNLKMAHVDLDSGLLRVVQGKGQKDRNLPINCSLRPILQRYLKERDRLEKTTEYFFASTSKNVGFSEKGFNKLIALLRKKTKLDFSGHSLRHTFATLMLEGGCDIYTLSKLMGHADITTTTIYLSTTTKHLEGSIEKHPLGFRK